MPLTTPTPLSAEYVNGKMRVTCTQSVEDVLPTGSIASPAAVSGNTAAAVTVGDLVTLTVTSALDYEDVTVPDTGIHWYSDLAGDLGPNATRVWTAAVPGLHTLRARLTDKDGGYTDLTRLLQVNAPAGSPATVTQVVLYPYNPGLAVGQTTTLTPYVFGTNNPSQSVNYASSNAAVATVNSSGLVTAVAVGRATITATSQVDGTKTGSVTVVVRPAGKASYQEDFAGLADAATTVPGWTDRWSADAGEFYIGQGATSAVSVGVPAVPGTINGSRLRTSPSVAELRLKSWDLLNGLGTGALDCRFASNQSTAQTGVAGLGFCCGGTPSAPTGYVLFWYLDASGNVQLRFNKYGGSTTPTTPVVTTIPAGTLAVNTTYELGLVVPSSRIFSASVYAATDQLRTTPLATITMPSADSTYATGWWGAVGRSVAFHAWGDFRYTEL